MEERALRRSVIGLVAGGLVFGAMALYMNAVAGVELFSNLGPVGIMALIGGTVGGLAGPLVGGLLERLRDRRGE